MSFKIKYYYAGHIMQANMYGHVICMAIISNAYKILMEILKERDHLEDLWKDVIKMDLKEIVCDKVDWIKLLKPSGNFTYDQV
jgi:hypothetical protein